MHQRLIQKNNYLGTYIVESFECHHLKEINNSIRKRRSLTEFGDICSCNRSQITQIFNEQVCFAEL